jgi:hypothetical protein
VYGRGFALRQQQLWIVIAVRCYRQQLSESGYPILLLKLPTALVFRHLGLEL